MKTFEFTIRKNLHNERLDIAMVELGIPLSRRKIRKVIDLGGAYLNNKRIRVASRQVQTGDTLKIHYQEQNLVNKPKATEWELDANAIVYRSSDLVALNKPPGLPSQATLDQSLVHAETALKEHISKKFNDHRPLTLLHRLDKETSGILLFAHTPKTSEHISTQFRERKIKKTYLALVYGKPDWTIKSIDCLLSPIDKRLGVVRKVQDGGKQAVTEFRFIDYSPEQNVSLVACFPKTGRSHQLRKHLEILGSAIVGDKRYGPGNHPSLKDRMAELSATHHFLHAAAIELKQVQSPGEILSISAPVPPQFQEALDLAGLKIPSTLSCITS